MNKSRLLLGFSTISINYLVLKHNNEQFISAKAQQRTII